jgi:4-aminobutyrate aminotransferase
MLCDPQHRGDTSQKTRQQKRGCDDAAGGNTHQAHDIEVFGGSAHRRTGYRPLQEKLQRDQCFIEPMMSDGCIIVPPVGFLKTLQERCRRHGILIVVDEVKVGLGRSGMMHCFEHEGLEPDLVIFGKGLGGGLPLSAVVGPQSIMDHAPAFALLTPAGNPVATAAGGAVLRVIDEDGLIERSARIGTLFADGLRALSTKHAMIGDVRGRGLAVGVDLVTDRQAREPVHPSVTAKIIYRGYQLGAAFTYVGLKANVLEFMPPLTLSEDEAAEGVAIVDQAITDVADGRVADADAASFMMW